MPIPTFAPNVSLSCLADIDISGVRRVSRFLKTQEMPPQSRHQHDLVQPLVFALDRYAINPGSDDAGLAHWLYTLGTAFIFFRTAGTNPLTTAEMRRRAALLVTSVSNGTFPTCWRNFTADALRRCIAEETV